MSLFLTILEGPSPSEAKPLIATSDAHLIGLVAQELFDRLGGVAPGRALELAPKARLGELLDPGTDNGTSSPR